MSILTKSNARHAQPGAGRPRKLVAIIAALVGLFVLTACHYIGSGTMVSSEGYGKATFTFNLNCPTGGGAYGLVTYVDTPAGVSFHGVVPGSALQTTCTKQSSPPSLAKPQLFTSGNTFQGSYTPLKPGAGGTFTITVFSGGTAQSLPGFICLQLSGGIYDGYSNARTVQWGNVVLVS